MTYSIVLPVRNGGHYIKQCIDSIFRQTLPDFNLLVLDNCSTDGTLEWLHSLDDLRLRIFPADRPLSIEENWGRITGIPKNEFITLIGHDDILDPQYLEIMDSLIRRHPGAGLYQAHFRYIDARGGLIRRCKPMDERQTGEEFLAFFLAGLIDNMGTGYMMRSVDYDAIGGIPPYPNLLFADFELWIALSVKGYKATAYEECFAFRLHQSMTTSSSDLKLKQALGIFVGYLERLRAVHPSMETPIRRYAAIFLMTYCKALSHRMLRTPLRKRGHLTVASFIEECRSYAERLGVSADFHPEALWSMRFGALLDRYALTRQAFLFFKRLYPKPVLNT